MASRDCGFCASAGGCSTCCQNRFSCVAAACVPLVPRCAGRCSEMPECLSYSSVTGTTQRQRSKTMGIRSEMRYSGNFLDGAGGTDCTDSSSGVVLGENIHSEIITCDVAIWSCF
eukprot:4308751-Amphidinium_carterae.1